LLQQNSYFILSPFTATSPFHPFTPSPFPFMLRFIKEDYLQQNSFTPYDKYCPFYKSVEMMRNIATFHRLATGARVFKKRFGCVCVHFHTNVLLLPSAGWPLAPQRPPAGGHALTLGARCRAHAPPHPRPQPAPAQPCPAASPCCAPALSPPQRRWS